MMPIAQAINNFKAAIAQCDALISNAHKLDVNGVNFLPFLDREQITVAAFLNMFIAWESYIENALHALMVGAQTTSGRHPLKYVSPPTSEVAQSMIVGVNRYFDFGNQENLKKIAKLYFDQGYPFEPHLSAITLELCDIKIIRNAAAHTSSTTQRALEALALRIFGQPKNGITSYQLLTSVDPRTGNGETVFLSYKNKLEAAAELICIG